MPRYFFETSDDDQLYRDEDGIELAGHDEARTAVLSSLPDMARDKIPDGDRRTFRSIVRDDGGKVLYRATLTLVGGWEEADQA